MKFFDRKRDVRRLLLTSAAAAAVVAAGLVATTAHADHHVEVPSGDGEQFVWPVSAWVSANHEYPPGSHHSGSADLTISHYAPMKPVRDGEVIYSQYRNGSYGVGVWHEGVEGHGYVSEYGHLAEEPEVEVGDQVDLDTVLGYVGRSGMAYWAGPHIHFSIREYDGGEPFAGDPVKIPDFEIGDWVDSGDYIPGVYEDLEPIQERPERDFDVRVATEELRVYETPDRQTDEQIAEVTTGDELTVVESHRGQYRVEVDGELGWIAHSGTLPVESSVFGVEVTASDTANIRSEPTESDDNLIGVIPADLDPYLPGFEMGGQSGDWMLVMWRCDADSNRSDDPADDETALGGCPSRDDGQTAFWKYGWIGPANAQPSEEFHTRVWVPNLNVHGNQVVDGQDQPDSSVKLGELGEVRDLVHVREVFNGWYRIDYDGETAWVRGWFTGGIH